MNDPARDPKQIANLIRRARKRRGLSQGSFAKEVLEEVAQTAVKASPTVENQSPRDFPEYIHGSVKAGLAKRIKFI